MKNLMVAVLFIAASLVPVFAEANTILASGHTWEYTFTDPTGDTNWNTTTGGWLTGPAPFGNNIGGSYDPAGDFDWATYWATDGADGDDLWVRTGLNLTGYDLSTVRWDLGVDNGFSLYANGTLVSSANGEGYTTRWEYTGDFSSLLHPGDNVFAVALEDHGGLTAFDMQVTGRASVPEPTILLLLGLGLIGAAGIRRIKK